MRGKHPGLLGDRMSPKKKLTEADDATAGRGAPAVNTWLRLRAKIEQDPGHPTFVLTVWSVGYKFRDRHDA